MDSVSHHLADTCGRIDVSCEKDLCQKWFKSIEKETVIGERRNPLTEYIYPGRVEKRTRRFDCFKKRQIRKEAAGDEWKSKEKNIERKDVKAVRVPAPDREKPHGL